MSKFARMFGYLAWVAALSPFTGAATGYAQQRAGGDPAKDFPSKPIRWIIDFGAGGLSDTLARIVGQKLTDAWGQPIINDARPGVNGTLANEIGSKAPAAGYNLLFLATPFSVKITVLH